MDRRGYLAALGGALTAAGVAAVYRRGNRSDEPAGADNGTAGEMVPEAELDRAAPRDGIPAIVDPVFAPSWETADAGEAVSEHSLDPEDDVIGIERGPLARAYPLKLLRRHEVVNDTLDSPQLITYCPVCRSGLVADRTVAGRTRTFGVSGYLYQANLVLYDRASESLWSQLGSRAIRGPLTGTRLDRTGSAITTWGEWRTAVPDTTVLLPPPASNTVIGPVSFNYSLEFYEQRDRITDRYPDYGLLGELEWSDTRLKRRALVVGVGTGDSARAYPKRAVQREGVVTDVVGSLPVVVTTTDSGRLRAYERRLGGEWLDFDTRDGDLIANGSRWSRVNGRALDGPHEGERLPVAPGRGPLYWAAWLVFNPDSTVYGLDG